LSDDDRAGLRLSYVATRGDLNDAEQRNITAALLRRPPSAKALLDERYLRTLHHAMFGQVWAWAGTYRRVETNIGVSPLDIAAHVRNLVDDARAWVELATYPADELAVRFHHRLVWVHPFPNGNGRHGRIAADYLALAMGRRRLTWGAHLDVTMTELRARYIGALRAADADDIEPLVAFARS
jgi:Fic-DOC domain mobile mystery protein B